MQGIALTFNAQETASIDEGTVSRHTTRRLATSMECTCILPYCHIQEKEKEEKKTSSPDGLLINLHTTADLTCWWKTARVLKASWYRAWANIATAPSTERRSDSPMARTAGKNSFNAYKGQIKDKTQLRWYTKEEIILYHYSHPAERN